MRIEVIDYCSIDEDVKSLLDSIGKRRSSILQAKRKP